MDIDQEKLQAAQAHLYDPETDLLAPIVTWGGMVLLQDDEPLVGSLAQAKLDGDTTRWRVLWVTATRLIFAEASKELAGWDAYTSDQEAGTDDLVTWCRPLTDVERLELVDQESWRERRYSERRTWQMGARLALRGGPTVDLPLFGGRPTYRSRESVEALIAALGKRLWRPAPTA